MIKNNEKFAGVTAHAITSAVDQGQILMQEPLPISRTETQGSLRKKLSGICGKMSVEVVRHCLSDISFPESRPNTNPSKQPKFDLRESDLDLNMEWENFYAHLRALLPWPGATIDGIKVNEILDIQDCQEEPINPPREIVGHTLILKLAGKKLTLQIANAKQS
jgi:methionyl-tRNA formyltransferase